MLDTITRIINNVLLPVWAAVNDWLRGLDLAEMFRQGVYLVFHLSLTHYLLLSAALFTIGLLGVMTRRNLIALIISIELMLNAANINFVAFSQYLGQNAGGVMAVLVLALAAAEAAVGLAIGLYLYRRNGTIDVEQFNLLRG